MDLIRIIIARVSIARLKDKPQYYSLKEYDYDWGLRRQQRRRRETA